MLVLHKPKFCLFWNKSHFPWIFLVLKRAISQLSKNLKTGRNPSLNIFISNILSPSDLCWIDKIINIYFVHVCWVSIILDFLLLNTLGQLISQLSKNLKNVHNPPDPFHLYHIVIAIVIVNGNPIINDIIIVIFQVVVRNSPVIVEERVVVRERRPRVIMLSSKSKS